MSGLTLKTMKLAPDLVARVEAHREEHGLASWTAAAVALMERGLDGDAGAMVAALPKAPKPAPAKAKARTPAPAGFRKAASVVKITGAQTETPPPMKGARVSEIAGLQHGRQRPAFGSMLKGPKPPRR